LNPCAESGSFLSRHLVQLYLLECDSLGRVVWMSNYARTVLGEPKHLIETAAFSFERPASRVWRVWQSRERMVLAVQPIQQEDDASGGLVAVQARMLAHLFQLLRAERRLFLGVQPKRRSSGRKAIRQMELERRRLGRELHTGAGQALAAIRLQLELIASDLPAPSEHVQLALERIGTLASDTLEQVRSISRRLHPPEWQRLTLEDAIRQLWEIAGISERYGAVLQMDPLPADPDLEVKVLLYRTLQEALSNLVRHAMATQVTVSLQLAGDWLTLTIQDNGVGFDADRLIRGPVEVGAGIGIRSIREQAEALGGKMSIESGDSGTRLVVSVAVSPAEG
jgi:signal transduction histidine kinase